MAKPKSTPRQPQLTPEEKLPELIRGTHRMLELLGENPEREGLRETPKRHAKAFQFLTSGYQADIGKIVGKAIFEEKADGIVMVRDVEVFSLCEHHLLPFWGKAHVAYIPDGKVIGLSKIPRIIDAYGRRLQVQERLTTQVAEELMTRLKPRGVAVVIEAYHMCIMMRGVAKQRSFTVTSSLHGVFLKDPTTRHELFQLLNSTRGGPA